MEGGALEELVHALMTAHQAEFWRPLNRMPAETVASLLGWGRDSLGQAGIDKAAFDARLLLQHVTDLDHGALIGRPETEVSETTAVQFRELVDAPGQP